MKIILGLICCLFILTAVQEPIQASINAPPYECIDNWINCSNVDAVVDNQLIVSNSQSCRTTILISKEFFIRPVIDSMTISHINSISTTSHLLFLIKEYPILELINYQNNPSKKLTFLHRLSFSK
ncbi:MAG: hypothetical protein US15_C0012G0012 [Candidatus Moranbacteria bacterium GW2011_GWF1_36_4]|nr:MAG: hypothetical protein US15_C0012G0012 [Candidatus Moranbacteria bacterium GW2011_GWF1_36_4]